MIGLSIEIRIGTEVIKNFSSLIIKQSFNHHHWFEFYIPSDKEESNAVFLKEGSVKYIGKEITIKWGDEKKQVTHTFNGIISKSIYAIRQREDSSFYVAGYSTSFVLMDLPKTRSFFDKDPKNPQQTLEEVVKKVVKDAQKDHYCTLSCKIANNVKLPYLVQYKESTFDFLNRLAIRYGEWFYIEGKTLYFGSATNHSKTYDLLVDKDLFSLNYELIPHPVRLDVIGYNHQLGNKFTISTDKKSLGKSLDNIYDIQRNMFGMTQGNEYLAWQPNSAEEVKKQAEYEYQKKMVDTVGLNGESDKVEFKLGDLLKLKSINKNSEESLYECRVIEVTHYINGSNDTVYRNEFKAIDKNLEYIPIDPNHIPKPYNAQSEYAEVISTKESSGRVQVSFFWNDVGGGELNKSFYMPCLSAYSGGKGGPDNKGILFIPDVGDTVLIGYYQGDPNHPYVMGGLHNSKTAKIKEEHQENNDIKSIITASGHMIEFNDKNGEESITVIDKSKNKIKLNKEGIEITHKNNNTITMKESGIEITAQKDIKITAKKLEIVVDNMNVEAKVGIDQKAGSSEVKIGTDAIAQKAGSSEVKIAAAAIEQKSGASEVKIGPVIDIKAPMVKIS